MGAGTWSKCNFQHQHCYNTDWQKSVICLVSGRLYVTRGLKVILEKIYIYVYRLSPLKVWWWRSIKKRLKLQISISMESFSSNLNCWNKHFAIYWAYLMHFGETAFNATTRNVSSDSSLFSQQRLNGGEISWLEDIKITTFSTVAAHNQQWIPNWFIQRKKAKKAFANHLMVSNAVKAAITFWFKFSKRTISNVRVTRPSSKEVCKRKIQLRPFTCRQKMCKLVSVRMLTLRCAAYNNQPTLFWWEEARTVNIFVLWRFPVCYDSLLVGGSPN